MPRKICSVWFLSLHLFISPALVFSEITTIYSLNEIPIHEFSKKTLVIFDLDDVLIYPQDALMQNWRSGWKPKEIREWTSEEYTIAWLSAKFQLMDPFGPTLIYILNDNEIPTIGFSSFAMKQSGFVTSIPSWRSNHLEELGLNFKVKGEFVFPGPEGFIPASFEKGVLYCGDFYKKDKNSKAKVLSLYLAWFVDYTPDKIVFVDDEKHHLESVEKELKKRDISFLGFLYIPKKLDVIDEKIADLQYRTIINNKIWLSDQEAESFLWERP